MRAYMKIRQDGEIAVLNARMAWISLAAMWQTFTTSSKIS